MEQEKNKQPWYRPTKGARTSKGTLFVLLILLLFMAVSVSETEGPADNEVDGSRAYVIAQNYVERALKSPSTAEFPSRYGAEDIGDGVWEVFSYVDSQNAFGAQLRSNWRVTMKHNGGNWTHGSSWELQKMIVNGEQFYP